MRLTVVALLITAAMAVLAVWTLSDPSVADARPKITAERADVEAAHELAVFAEVLESTSTELDPCEVEGRHAYCDFTFVAPDWGVCDGEFTVQFTRRGRAVVGTELLWCDEADELSGDS